MAKKENWILFLVAGLYMLNLLAGVIEVIPDNTPLFGNIDELIATILLLKTDPTGFFKKWV